MFHKVKFNDDGEVEVTLIDGRLITLLVGRYDSIDIFTSPDRDTPRRLVKTFNLEKVS